MIDEGRERGAMILGRERGAMDFRNTVVVCM